MLKIGDKVVVVDDGKCYDTYDEMSELMALDGYVSGREISEGVTCTVKALSYHGFHTDIIIAGVEDGDGNHYMVSEDGLSAYEEPKPITEEELVKLWRDNAHYLLLSGNNMELLMTGYYDGDDCPVKAGPHSYNFGNLVNFFTHYWTKSTGKQPLK